MNLHEIAERLEIGPVGRRYVSRLGDPLVWADQLDDVVPIGEPPEWDAMLCEPGDTVVYQKPMLVSAVDSILHEICHAVVGPPIERCEIGSGLIALQWALIGQLRDRPRLYAIAQARFGEYVSDGYTTIRELGRHFQQMPEWKRSVRAAVKAGLLTKTGQVIWGQGTRWPKGST
jgi:hypothetical protein